LSRYIPQIFFSSVKELNINIKKITDAYLESGIVLISGLKLKEEEHLDLAKKMGDILGWFPNSNTSFWKHRCIEDHSRTDKTLSDADNILIDWHLEHVDYDIYCPIVGALWNMWNFKENSEVGKTLFVDSCEVYEMLTKSEQDFLAGCILEWFDSDLDNPGSGPHQAPVIVEHWISKKPLIRIEITTSVETVLKKNNGKNPSEEDIKLFNDIKNKILNIISNNNEIRFTHKWTEGDVLIPDLQRMAHTITGGFSSEKRTFTNFWTFSKNPDILKDNEKPLVWR
jgi:alpha-ketoglutarate-dependent taurine dioxygenase